MGDVSHASPVVAGVSLGGLHSAFLDVQGAVYTFGDNRRGGGGSELDTVDGYRVPRGSGGTACGLDGWTAVGDLERGVCRSGKRSAAWEATVPSKSKGRVKLVR